MNEALEAVQDAYISVSCLLEDQDWTSTFIDTNNKNDSEIVSLKIKDVKQLEKDLEHIRNQLNIIENFLDPFVVAELEEMIEEKS